LIEIVSKPKTLFSIVGSESFFQCGGTLVAHNLVVSAGHCFKQTDPSLYTIALGKQLIGPVNVECQDQVFQVEKYVFNYFLQNLFHFR
jgi:V8-like Glu-specific endopeptidase